MLAEVPSDKRTQRILNNIHISIERFKELRRNFSNFDESGNAEGIKSKGSTYKPLVEKMNKLNTQLYWLLPIVRNKHKIYNFADGDNDVDDIDGRQLGFVLSEQNEIIAEYVNNNIPDERNKYKYLLQNINPYYTPFLNPDNTENVITQQDVLNNIEVVIDNLGNLYSNMIRGIKTKNFLEQVTNNDTVSVTGLLSLTNPFIQYSRINLPKTSIFMKVNLHRFNFMYHKILLQNLELERKIISEENLKDKNFKIDFNMQKFNVFSFKETKMLVDRNNDEIYNDLILEKNDIYIKILNSSTCFYISNFVLMKYKIKIWLRG